MSGQLLFDFEADTGDPDEAAAALSLADGRRAVARPREPNDADASFNEALRLEAEERFAEAAELYRRWLQEHGPAASVCFNLGNMLRTLGRHEAAIERFWQAVELDPRHAQAWNNLGEVLAETGQVGVALNAWRRSVALEPDCAEALYNLADALQSLGRVVEARPYWQSYLQHDAQSEWAAYARSCLA